LSALLSGLAHTASRQTIGNGVWALVRHLWVCVVHLQFWGCKDPYASARHAVRENEGCIGNMVDILIISKSLPVADLLYLPCSAIMVVVQRYESMDKAIHKVVAIHT
jgi:hypothetical protein